MKVPKLRVAVVATALTALLGPALASSAVSPPLGPVATVQQANTREIGTGILHDVIEQRIEEIVAATNAALEAQGKWSRASLGAVTARVPSLTPTEHVEWPNEYFVRQSFAIEIDVAIPLASDRTVSFDIDIDAFCDDWYQSAGGVMRFFSRVGPAFVEGGSIFEDILNVSDLIDAKVRADFRATGPVAETQLDALGGECATIGVQVDLNMGADLDGIIWNPPLHFHNTQEVQDRIEVTPLTLRRLAAREFPSGAPIGAPIEEVMLEVSANFHGAATAPMAMAEDDVVALNLQPMVLYGEPTTSLVVIGTVRGTVVRSMFTAFAFSTKSASYSPGTHTLQIMAEYWTNDLNSYKPIKRSVPAYELTYHVKYVPRLAGVFEVPQTGGGGVLGK